MIASKPRLTLYSRAYCHLCHDMLAALETLRSEQGGSFEIDVLDVDADPEMLARFDELVPVLTGFEGTARVELCHYFLDEPAVLAYLDRIVASASP